MRSNPLSRSAVEDDAQELFVSRMIHFSFECGLRIVGKPFECGLDVLAVDYDAALRTTCFGPQLSAKTIDID